MLHVCLSGVFVNNAIVCALKGMSLALFSYLMQEMILSKVRE